MYVCMFVPGNLTRRKHVLDSIVANRSDEALILLLGHVNIEIVSAVTVIRKNIIEVFYLYVCTVWSIYVCMLSIVCVCMYVCTMFCICRIHFLKNKIYILGWVGLGCFGEHVS